MSRALHTDGTITAWDERLRSVGAIEIADDDVPAPGLREIRHTPDESHRQDPTLLCVHAAASPEIVEKVLAAPVDTQDDGNGRSEFRWFRLVDGTLILGIFLHGDTYFEATLDEHMP